MGKTKKVNGELVASAPAPSAPAPAPREAKREYTDAELGVADEPPLVVPREPSPDGGFFYAKNPSVVVLMNGRYGVAHTGVGGSGYVHEATTYATRREAERRAWALARELGVTRDWP